MEAAPRRASTRPVKRKRYDDDVYVTPSPPSRSGKRPSAPQLAGLARWTPEDDLALITAVLHTNDLETVHLHVEFSRPFPLSELSERWYALLYDPVVSKLSQAELRQLSAETVARIQAATPYSQAEQDVLCAVPSTTAASETSMRELLAARRSLFHALRSPTALLDQWRLLRHCSLLDDQTDVPRRRSHDETRGDPLPPLDDSLTDDSGLATTSSTSHHDRRCKAEINQLERQIPRWSSLVERLTGATADTVERFDSQTYAILRGRLVAYRIKSTEVTFGRSTKDMPVTIDLSLDGPTHHVSRLQGTIAIIEKSCELRLTNKGSHAVYVDGRQLSTGQSSLLRHNGVIEVSCIRLVVLINGALISRHKSD